MSAEAALAQPAEEYETLRELLIVAKFGGSSMAHPNRVRDVLEYEGNDAFAVVVSAPGVDEAHPVKATNMLIDYDYAKTLANIQADGSVTQKDMHEYREYIKETYKHAVGEEEIDAAGDNLPQLMRDKLFELIPDRFRDVVNKMDPEDVNDDLSRILAEMPNDLSNLDEYEPAPFLGEYWMAKLFAAYTEREFVDARELIVLDEDWKIDRENSRENIRLRVADKAKKYVVGGFYAADINGDTALLDRGGSDITAALIAEALGADEHHNWSDAPGYMSADPKTLREMNDIPRMQPHITYPETAEFAAYGDPTRTILHGDVAGILLGSGVKTRMRYTFGDPSESGTLITDGRSSDEAPIIGVTGRGNVISLSLARLGMASEVGATTALFSALEYLDIPYDHVTTGEHAVTIWIPDTADGTHRRRLEYHLRPNNPPSPRIRSRLGAVTLGRAGMVHIVGEGLTKPGAFRLTVLGQAALALGSAGIEGLGATDISESPGTTFFVNEGSVDNSVRILHKALALGEQKAA
jgi:aspartate kinase